MSLHFDSDYYKKPLTVNTYGEMLRLEDEARRNVYFQNQDPENGIHCPTRFSLLSPLPLPKNPAICVNTPKDLLGLLPLGLPGEGSGGFDVELNSDDLLPSQRSNNGDEDDKTDKNDSQIGVNNRGNHNNDVRNDQNDQNDQNDEKSFPSLKKQKSNHHSIIVNTYNNDQSGMNSFYNKNISTSPPWGVNSQKSVQKNNIEKNNNEKKHVQLGPPPSLFFDFAFLDPHVRFDPFKQQKQSLMLTNQSDQNDQNALEKHNPNSIKTNPNRVNDQSSKDVSPLIPKRSLAEIESPKNDSKTSATIIPFDPCGIPSNTCSINSSYITDQTPSNLSPRDSLQTNISAIFPTEESIEDFLPQNNNKLAKLNETNFEKNNNLLESQSHSSPNNINNKKKNNDNNSQDSSSSSGFTALCHTQSTHNIPLESSRSGVNNPKNQQQQQQQQPQPQQPKDELFLLNKTNNDQNKNDQSNVSPLAPVTPVTPVDVSNQDGSNLNQTTNNKNSSNYKIDKQKEQIFFSYLLGSPDDPNNNPQQTQTNTPQDVNELSNVMVIQTETGQNNVTKISKQE